MAGGEVADRLHPLETKILLAFAGAESLWEMDLVERTGLDQARVQTAVEWLRHKGLLHIETEQVTPIVSLTDLGAAYSTKKIPELRLLQVLQGGRQVTIEELRTGPDFTPEEISRGLGTLKALRLVTIGTGGALEPGGGSRAALEEIQSAIEFIETRGQLRLDDLPLSQREIVEAHARKRVKTEGIFRVTEQKARRLALDEGGRAARDVLMSRAGGTANLQEVSQLTPEMLRDGAWRGRAFRRYDISLKPSRILVGRRHPYREFLDAVKATLVALGFEEMRGPLVESEFWNMDALYMPQFHSAREIHDVYYLKPPRRPAQAPPAPVARRRTGGAAGPLLDPSLLQRVARTHRDGGRTGSRGWGYAYNPERARRLLLRSHGTAISARTLSRSPRVPGKYFAMARCFRYEQVDVTHATDFFQVEGIVLGPDIHLRTLLGLLELFGREVARAEAVRFVPAYFPFTEPSVELQVRHPKLGWMELGGAGLFRPEVTGPLGVTVPVIAWGLGLDRMAMVALNLQDIRDLFTADLEAIRAMPARR